MNFLFAKLTNILLFTLVIIVWAVKPEMSASLNIEYIKFLCIVTFISLIFHFVSNFERNYFRIDVIFIIGFMIVHFQWAIMLSFSSITPLYLTFNIVDHNVINFGVWLSSLGLISWLFGYNITNPKTAEFTISTIKFPTRVIYFGWLFFLLFLVASGQHFLSGALYKGGGEVTGIANYLRIISNALAMLIIIYSFLDRENLNKSNRFFGIGYHQFIFVTCFVFIFLYAGDRGAAISAACLFLFVYGTWVRPITLKWLVFLIITGAIILTIVGINRSGEDGISDFFDTLAVSNLYQITQELSNSARVLYIAIEDINNGSDYHYGGLWVSKILSLFPFAQSVYLEFVEHRDHAFGTGQYITYLRYGPFSTSGEGSTLITDIFLNFGYVGVVIFMGLFGGVIKSVYSVMKQKGNLSIIIVACIFASYALYQGRAGLFDTLRDVVWTLFISWALIQHKFIFNKR